MTQSYSCTCLSVSVILPVHNGERFLAGALQNIQQQQYQPIEIIVIDDGSTDATAKIAAEFGDSIRYIYQSQQGPAAARNRGIEQSAGEIIAFLDVDDLWPENKLAHQVGYLAKHPDVDIAQGLIQRMQADKSDDDPDGLQRKQSEPLSFNSVFEPYFFINLGSCVYRRSLFEQVGLFDEALWDNEDTDWFTRAWEKNINKVSLSEIGLFYRKHDCNMTLQQKNLVYFGLMKIYKRRIARSRANPALATQERAVGWAEYLGQPPD
ncbi:MAG: glycosyltransferase family A protein [Cyanobacteria bacterium P01_D01_bin.105]